MSSVLAGVLIVALLCAGGALWLWQRATLTQQRQSTERFVDSRLAAGASQSAASRPPGGARAQVAPGMGGAPMSSAALGVASMPGMRGAQTSAQAQGKGDGRNAQSGTHRDVLLRLRPVIDHANRIAYRAGVRNINRFYALAGMCLAAIGLFVGVQTNFVASAFVLVLCVVVLRVWLWHRATRQQRRIVAQLPEFLDGVVRMITIGNSVAAAFQAAAPTVDLPLRDCLERASRMMRAGVELDKALNSLAELYDVEEFMLIASVVRLSVRYGGRADQVLDRMSAFMRDREMAQRELYALSSETRLSAWILGLLPLILGCFIVFSNPQYFVSMWLDATGRHLIYGAAALQLGGIFLLYRLAKF